MSSGSQPVLRFWQENEYTWWGHHGSKRSENAEGGPPEWWRIIKITRLSESEWLPACRYIDPKHVDYAWKELPILPTLETAQLDAFVWVRNERSTMTPKIFRHSPRPWEPLEEVLDRGDYVLVSSDEAADPKPTDAGLLAAVKADSWYVMGGIRARIAEMERAVRGGKETLAAVQERAEVHDSLAVMVEECERIAAEYRQALERLTRAGLAR